MDLDTGYSLFSYAFAAKPDIYFLQVKLEAASLISPRGIRFINNSMRQHANAHIHMYVLGYVCVYTLNIHTYTHTWHT